MFHIFSLVCFFTYSVNSRSGHDQITTFGPIFTLDNGTLSFVEGCRIQGPKARSLICDRFCLFLLSYSLWHYFQSFLQILNCV